MEDTTEEQISLQDLQKHFLHSLENIIDESCSHSRRYWCLEFHEFQEFLCRVALQLFPKEKAIEYKVYNLLDLVYRNEGINDKARAEASSPDGVAGEVDITLVAINENEEC